VISHNLEVVFPQDYRCCIFSKVAWHLMVADGLLKAVLLVYILLKLDIIILSIGSLMLDCVCLMTQYVKIVEHQLLLPLELLTHLIQRDVEWTPWLLDHVRWWHWCLLCLLCLDCLDPLSRCRTAFS
jgi:hypothetical protein